jgi:hypothetical protein
VAITAMPASAMPDPSSCPLVGRSPRKTCENEYHFYSAILAGVIKYITGLDLARIEGRIARPQGRRVISIAQT